MARNAATTVSVCDVSRQIRGNRRIGFLDRRLRILRSDRANDTQRLLQHRTDAEALAAKGAQVGVCGSCMDARGIKPEMLAEGAHRSSMDELTRWTEAAGKVLVF